MSTDDALASALRELVEMRNRLEESERALRELEQKNSFMRKVFGRYVNDDVADTILDAPRGLPAAGGRRRVTLIFSDLRGFSSVCEQLAPEDVVRLLNIYLGAMADVINVWQGTLLDFSGDAVQAVFGLGGSAPDDPERGVACALAMQNAMAEVNSGCRTAGLPSLEMGIGVHTGDVVIGSVGSRRRLKYGLVGSAANLASRVESVTVGGQVLISEATLRELGGRLVVLPPFEVMAKGFRGPVRVYEVHALLGRYAIELRRVHDPLHSLETPMATRLTLLEGKASGTASVVGNLVAVSPRRAVVAVPELLALRQDLRFDVLEDPGFEGIFGKIVEVGADNTCTVRFTSSPASLRALLSAVAAQRSVA